MTQSDPLHSAALDALEAQVAVVDPRGLVRSVNASWQRAGRPAPGEPYIDALAHLESAALRRIEDGIAAVRTAAAPRFFVQYQEPGCREEIWWVARGTALDWEGERLVVVSHVDVTARVALERELEASRNQLQRFVDHLPAGAVYVAGDEVRVNAAVEAITGYSKSELRTLASWFRRLHGEDAETMRARFEQDRHAGFPSRVTVPVSRADGEARSVEMTAWSEGDEAVILLHDVTDAARMAQTLREQEALLRTLVENAADGIVTFDEAGIIHAANRAAAKLLRTSAQALVGQRIDDYFESPILSFEEGREAIQGRARSACRILPPAGHPVPCEIAISEIPGPMSRLFAAFIRDVREQRRLQRQVLETADREQRVIGQELHDGIGQTLVGLSFLSSSHARRLDTTRHAEAPAAAELAQGIAAASSELRTIARGLVPYRANAANLAEVLSDLAATTAKRAGIEITYTAPPGTGRALEDDDAAAHIYRIAQEALANAIRHADATRIDLDLRCEAGRFVLTVADNGRGEFEPNARTRGLGLRTMAYRAALIGAILDVEANPGQGTRIRCTVALYDKP
jgi:PAS domain S-box-containing protein